MNYELISIIVISSVIIITTLYVGFSILKQYLKDKRTQFFVTNFEHYITSLEYHMSKAYDMIYKDKILIFSIEATKIDDKEFKVVLKDFLKLSMSFLGTALKNELIEFYGSEETLLFSMTEYFNNRFENDEIRKDSMENLMNEE